MVELQRRLRLLLRNKYFLVGVAIASLLLSAVIGAVSGIAAITRSASRAANLVENSDAAGTAASVVTVPMNGAPVPVPAGAPVPVPVGAPAPVPAVGAIPQAPGLNADGEIEPIFINCGSTEEYTDVLGRTWVADVSFVGGTMEQYAGIDIVDSQDDPLYQSERVGDSFQYQIPIPPGDYEIVLYFAEKVHTAVGERVFSVTAEGAKLYTNIDLVSFGEGIPNRALTREKGIQVKDGTLNLVFDTSSPGNNGSPLVSAIQIKSLGPHLAHSVAGGPYSAVDTDGNGSAEFQVDAGGSHTHAADERLVEYIWRSGFEELGKGEVTMLTLPVGSHPLTLSVKDSAGNKHTETTVVTILSSDHPNISGISPLHGDLVGGTVVTITGTGFSLTDSTVKFGTATLTGSDVTVVDKSTIRVTAPPGAVAVPVQVSVTTPLGDSNSNYFTYLGDGIPIDFTSGLMFRIQQPSAAAVGPDRRLYVGTLKGELHRIQFIDGRLKVENWVIADVAPNRAILGIAFDPLDTANFPSPYFSHSSFFHGEWQSSSGEAINGKVSRASGQEMDEVEDIITGLPVSDHDHGLNGLVFGDHGELYITVGGNTNAGVPGPLSSSLRQKENVLSASILVANNVRDPNFDGQIKYDSPDDGNVVGNPGVEIFAPGFRNPFGIVLHSNGNLYASDNSPNLGYGDVSMGCNGESVSDIDDLDRLILVERDNYYGHANRKRGSTDPRQCVWRSTKEPSGDGYTASLLAMEPASGGLMEYRTNHFGGQLRGNLIQSKYNGALHRIILADDGKSVIPESTPALPLVGDKSLALAQAASGEIIEIRYEDADVFFHRAIEPDTQAMEVTGVFPYRGTQDGGTTLHVYGKNLKNGGAAPTVTVGGKNCPVDVVLAFRLACTLPPGSGTVDVLVQVGPETSIFVAGYRYIQGF